MTKLSSFYKGQKGRISMHTECCHPADLIVEIKLLNGKVYHVCRGCGRGLAAFARFCEAPDNSGTLTVQNKIETTSTALDLDWKGIK